MKYHGRALFFILFLATLSHAQDTSGIIHIDSIPAQGILLDKGWKFHRGDNPEYAKPGYDDRAWQLVNPASGVHDSLMQKPKSGMGDSLSQMLKSGICWFRIHFFADSTVNHPLALIINQSGASELYLNGNLLAHFGQLSSNPGKIRAYDPWGKPVLLPLNGGGKLVLAVRYILQPNVSYSALSPDGNLVLKIRISTLESGIEQYSQQFSSGLSVLEIFRVGVFFILAILHLAFYLFYPTQKANLYFFLFALFMFFYCITGIRMLVHTVEYKFYYYNLTMDLGDLGFLFMLTALYSLFGKKRGWVFWALTTLTIIGVLLNAYTHVWGEFISQVILPNIIDLEIARIAFKSVRAKKRGGWIILAGAIGFLIFVMASIFAAIFGFYNKIIIAHFQFINLTFNLANLSIPIATSIYLGLDFAFTNRALKQKLSEVEDLSKKSIAQEQEKQNILATQNETLERQVNDRTAALSQSLKELNDTQAQLIQQEKMASLGELTAGIAHEIQNPLNFINNFSEVNKELIGELNNEIESSNFNQVKSIARDIEANEDKIINHGKRADAIVKGMLLHSRTGAGEKVPTDINAILDECLKISYHNMRTKDKSFEVQIHTDFDQSLGKFSFVPQDLVRVFVNLFNNAFYAVAEKKKSESDGYTPSVSVSTVKVGEFVTITVEDNGNGIPGKVIDKIFQPFFTTKPTGHGTGLGLSLSYDIIRAHGGEIKVESREGEGSDFIVQLPGT